MISGLTLMVLGMGMVFAFLLTMIAMMCLMAKLLSPFKNLLAEPEKKSQPVKKKAAPVTKLDQATLQAVVTAAIAKHRAESK